jgi:oligopeptide/dipeptide ABC transporter ATP-binding protein
LNPRRTVRQIISEPLLVWAEEEAGRPAAARWQERVGAWFAAVAGRVLPIWRYVAAVAAVCLGLWVVSEAADGRRLESQLGWLDTPTASLGIPALLAAVALLVPLAVLGLAWLAVGVLVPFATVSSYLGRIPALLGLASAAVAVAISGFLTWRTWDSFVGWPAWVVRGMLIALTAALVVWLAASVVRPTRAGASGVAAALAALVALQLFYIVGLDGVPKLAVLVASMAVDGFLARLVLGRLRARQAEAEAEAEPKVREMLEVVGINPDNALERRPWEFSGGQAQRLSIARALIMNPKIIICDEPVSALDVSVQAQVLNLLEDMKARYGLTLLFIAHDLAVVKNISDRVAVMYLGKLCEVANPDTLYARAAHPYTQLLLSAIPHPDPLVPPRPIEVAGELPSPIDPPSGCRFRTRCPQAQSVCAEVEPVLNPIGDDHYVACHFPDPEALTVDWTPGANARSGPVPSEAVTT